MLQNLIDLIRVTLTMSDIEQEGIQFLPKFHAYNFKIMHPPLGLVFGITLEGDFLET